MTDVKPQPHPSATSPGPRQRLLLALMKRFGLFSREERVFFALVPAIGIGTGIISVVFSQALLLTEQFFWGEGYHIVEAAKQAGPEVQFLAPVVGGVLLAALILATGGSVRTGMSNLIEAVALRQGYLSSLRTLLAQIGCILTVGAGRSAGREGPLILSGATLASKVGRFLGLRANPLKVLIGCGTAAGMAAAYNAPVGGAIFAMEVVLGNFALDAFGPIVISSVIATLISRRYMFPNGESVYEGIPAYTLASASELLLFVLLGLLAGGVAVLFVRANVHGESFFDTLPIPMALKPILGFALVGGIGVLCPYIYGNGYDTVNRALHGGLSQPLLLLLPFVKVLTTSITLGCGGVGGVFTPALFVGALLGGAFGNEANSLFAGQVSTPAAYALVGMGALASATTHAPISSILIIYEMTQSYSIILPLMAACIMSTLVSRALKQESIFTERLSRRGIRLPHRLEEIVMETMTARDILREDPITIKPADPVSLILDRFMDTRRNNLYVVDASERFLGAVALHDLKRVLTQSQDLDFVIAVDVMHSEFPFVTAGDALTRVLEVYAQYDHERLPVLEDADSRRFVGVISKRDIIAVYNQEVLGRPALLAKFTTDKEDGEETTYVELPPRYRVDQVEAGPGLVGRSLAELNLPGAYRTHVLSLKRLDAQRNPLRVIPDGATMLEPGDRLVVLGPSEQIQRLKAAAG